MSVSQRSRMYKIRHDYSLEKSPKTVPVLDKDQKPLMPTTLARAWSWIKSKKATYFYRKGKFCVRLNVEPSGRETQPIVLGIDPGSKFDGYTAKSYHSTHFNMTAQSGNDIKDRMENRKELRRARRFRTTPYRRCRPDRQSRFKLDKKDPIQSKFNKLPPSTRARWEFRLSVIKVLKSLFPITDIVIEDIQASTRKRKSKKTKQWNGNFSPLEVGKWAFYDLVQHVYPTIRLHLFKGFETSKMRQTMGLPKDRNKSSTLFWSHCVDSWVLATMISGNRDMRIDNIYTYYKYAYRPYRRTLHRQNHKKGHIRTRFGGSVCVGGFLNKDLVINIKTKEKSIVCGYIKDKLSLMLQGYGPRYCQNAKPKDYRLLSHNAWRLNRGIAGSYDYSLNVQTQ